MTHAYTLLILIMTSGSLVIHLVNCTQTSPINNVQINGDARPDHAHGRDPAPH